MHTLNWIIYMNKLTFDYAVFPFSWISHDRKTPEILRLECIPNRSFTIHLHRNICGLPLSCSSLLILKNKSFGLDTNGFILPLDNCDVDTLPWDGLSSPVVNSKHADTRNASILINETNH